MVLRRILAVPLSLVFWILLCASSVAASAPIPAPAPSSTFTLPEYMAELDRLSAALKTLDEKTPDASSVLKQIPMSWWVQTDRQTFEVSAGWLREDLTDWQGGPDEETIEMAIGRLQGLRSDAAAFEKPPAESSEARSRLSAILAGKDFHSVHGPDWTDRLKERLVEFLARLLGRTLASSVIPTIGNITVYGLMIAAFLLLVYWMYRSIRGSGELETILPHPLPVSSKAWTLWMADARAAAERGNWRDAIHLSYWCGVSFLEAQGLWRPDYARTPREYLRLLPSSSEHHPTLVALTRSFEVVWYGTQPADADAFARTLAQLEKLGCHPS